MKNLVERLTDPHYRYRKYIRLVKRLYQRFRFERGHPESILIILGCQRSGTTMMSRGIFTRDLRAEVFGEASELSSQDIPHHHRLDPLCDVKLVFDRIHAPLIVIKPIQDSQNASELLAYFEKAKAIWLYRHYKDVASSNIRKWGLQNGVNDLRPIVENSHDNWRSERVPDRIKDIVRQHYSESMNPYDAAALFWYVRNSLFFELHLDRHPEVTLCKYEELVRNPLREMQQIYEFIGMDFPGKSIIPELHTDSVGKGTGIDLSPEIDQVCRNLLTSMDQAYAAHRARTIETIRDPL